MPRPTPCPCDLTAPPRQRLAMRLRELRIDAEMTRYELADRVGTSATALSALEHGRRNVSTSMLERVAAALELDVPTVAVVLDETWAEGARRAQVGL